MPSMGRTTTRFTEEVMRFTTVTGSLYEVDTKAKKVRRLNGKADPSPRMGKDGEWRSYWNIHPSPPQVGESVVIAWGSDVELRPETKAIVAEGGFGLAVTTTSPVVEVDETVYN
jgi:hypothetical protein